MEKQWCLTVGALTASAFMGFATVFGANTRANIGSDGKTIAIAHVIDRITNILPPRKLRSHSQGILIQPIV